MPEDVRLMTPENIEIRFYLAGLCSRGKALFYDTLYQGIIALGATALLYNGLGGFFPPSAFFIPALSIAVNFFLYWGYHVLFETFMEGQTPGKRHFGLRVVTLDGQKIEFFPSMVRNLLRFVDFLPFGFVTGSMAVLFSNNHQRLGDLFSRTMVIRDQQDDRIPMPDAPPAKDPRSKLEQKMVFRGRKRV